MGRDGPELSAGRRALGLAAVAIAPLLLVGACELALRVTDAVDVHPLFVPVAGREDQLQANPTAILRFYRRAPELAIEPIPFPRERPAGRMRIVVQGGSTAGGFPYGRWAGLAGMLGDRLARADPDREIDVITTAMAAVNSYALLDFVDEIVAIEPDAVLIYAGHNEYLGILGVGSALTSTSWRRATLAHLGLRRWRVYQVLRGAVDALRSFGAAGAGPGATRGTLMAGAARSRHIPFGSELYRRGLQQFEANLAEILARYRRAGVRVYLGTLVSNERDLPPFAGAGADAGESADAWFERAQRERAAGRLDAARDAYRRAKDLDQLRFRAPEAFNAIVRRLAAEYGARLVDVQQRFADESPDGIVGHELILEHVHPTADGYFLLADAYYRALLDDGLIAEGPDAPGPAQARTGMPITGIDRWRAARAVRELLSDFPFSATPRPVPEPSPRTEIERIALALERGERTWLESMEALLQVHLTAGRLDRACVVARVAAQAYPDLAAPNRSAGLLHLQRGDRGLARRYLRRALRADPDDAEAARALARAGG